MNKNNICPQRYLHTKSIFYKYKGIHRMILYTTYNKYCVSYILLFPGMYVGVCLEASFYQFDFLLLSVCRFFSPHDATLFESLPVFTGVGVRVGEECVEGVSNTKSVSSCFGSLLLLFLLLFFLHCLTPVMSAVARFLLFFELL